MQPLGTRDSIILNGVPLSSVFCVLRFARRQVNEENGLRARTTQLAFSTEPRQVGAAANLATDGGDANDCTIPSTVDMSEAQSTEGMCTHE